MRGTSDKRRRWAVNRYIGARIRRRRTALELTPGELGGRLGVTAETVRKYESGQRSLDAVGLWRMSVALCVDAEYLVWDLLNELPASPPDRGARRVRRRPTEQGRSAPPRLVLVTNRDDGRQPAPSRDATRSSSSQEVNRQCRKPASRPKDPIH
jgi:transcriptional regulator with XRE-family HTH domain